MIHLCREKPIRVAKLRMTSMQAITIRHRWFYLYYLEWKEFLVHKDQANPIAIFLSITYIIEHVSVMRFSQNRRKFPADPSFQTYNN